MHISEAKCRETFIFLERKTNKMSCLRQKSYVPSKISDAQFQLLDDGFAFVCDVNLPLRGNCLDIECPALVWQAKQSTRKTIYATAFTYVLSLTKTNI